MYKLGNKGKFDILSDIYEALRPECKQSNPLTTLSGLVSFFT
jgi:hypothetical protein